MPSLHPQIRFSTPIRDVDPPRKHRSHLRSNTFMGCFPEVGWVLTLRPCLGNSKIVAPTGCPFQHFLGISWNIQTDIQSSVRSLQTTGYFTSMVDESTSLRRPCSPSSPLAHATPPRCASGCILCSKWVIIRIWVCLKMWYTPNCSHLIGIMIINHWV